MAPQFPTTTTVTASQPTRSPSANTSPAGSPPLILAFLAVGIFSAAMIAVFGWRRVQFGRDFAMWGPGAAGLSRRRFGDFTDAGSARSSTVGAGSLKLERPVLREVWTDRGKKPGGVDYGFWDNVMPLAVLPARHSQRSSDLALTTDQSLSAPHPPLSPEPLTSPPSGSPLRSAGTRSPTLSSPSHPSGRRRRFDDLIPLTLRRHIHPEVGNTAPPAPDATTPEKGAGEDEMPEETAQVVVLIEMPSRTSSQRRQRLHHPHTYQGYEHQQQLSLYPSPSKDETLAETHDRMRGELLGVEEGYFNHCLGIHTCPWPVPAPTNPHEA